MQPPIAKNEKSQASELLTLVAEQAMRYVDSVSERDVAPTRAHLAALSGFHEPFPSGRCDAADVLKQLDAMGSPGTVATTGGRYFGFVNGAIIPAALAASWIASAWNQNAALRVMSPVAAELEDVVLQWISEALGLPSGCEGGLVTCATMANFAALVTARHTLLQRSGWNVTEDGMQVMTAAWSS